MPGSGRNPLLFELLNQMDGLEEDADITFVLTTNRPDLLEPALAARPGRIDEAVEIDLPDAMSRERLIRLYGEGLDLRIADMDAVVARTEGVSAAFIKELLRKAAVAVAQQSEGDIVVDDGVLGGALDKMLGEGATMSRILLSGVDRPPPTTREQLQRWVMPNVSYRPGP